MGIRPQFEKHLFFDLPKQDLTHLLKQKGMAGFGAQQVFDWVYKKRQWDPSHWSNVAGKTKTYLSENFLFEKPRVLWQALSKDGTRKFLVGFRDKKSVETVLIPAKDRRTLCISTQVGCAIGCTFCHTGTQGLSRHLTPGEIVGQFISVQLWLNENAPGEEVTNIVYMGQGEPLHNFDNVKKATEIFLDPHGLGLGQRRITLSTSGLVPQIEKLHDFPPVNIAISLHAAHNNMRSELMPINKVYDLDRLLTAIKKIPLKAHRWITYEYLLIKDFNDRDEDIEALIKLLDKKQSKVNLIPFNEYPGSDFKRPSEEKIQWFNRQLNDRGLISTIRTTKGTDILAACGQLKSELDKANLWTDKSNAF